MHSFEDLSEQELDSHDQALREAALRASRCSDLAEDVSQEVWLETLRRPPAHVENLGAWLSVAASRVAWRLRRRETNRRNREEEVARPELSWSFAEEMEAKIAKARLRSAIDSLRDPYRETIKLQLDEGLGGPEIATRLGCSENTVRSRLRRGRQELRRILVRRTEAGPSRGAPERFFSLVAVLIGRRTKEEAAFTVVVALGVTAVLTAVLFRVAGSPFEGSPPTGDVRIAAESAPEGPHELEGRDGERKAVGVESIPLASRPSSLDEVASVEATHARLEIRGRVFSPAGPYPEAEIWAISDPGTDQRTLVGHADGEGYFAVSVNALDWIWADTWGFAGSRPLRADSLSKEKRGFLRLLLGRRVGRLDAVVLSPLGDPVSGASVQLLPPSSEEPTWSTDGTLRMRCPGGQGRTDSNGVAVMEQPPRKLCAVRIDAPGYPVEVQQHTFVDRYQDRTLKLSLPRPAKFSGRVFDREGRPLSQARLVARAGGSFPDVEVECDELGYFEFLSLPPRSVEFVVPPSAQGAPSSVLAKIDLRSGANVRDLYLGRADSLSGQVIEGGKPVSGVRIEAWSREHPEVGKPEVTFSDSDGRFSLLHGVEEELLLLAYPPGETSAFPRARVSIDPGEWDGRVELTAAHELGRVSGQVGVGFHRAGARLEIRSDSLPVAIPVEIDEFGSIVIPQLMAGSYELRAVVPSRGPQVIERIDLAEGQSLELGELDGVRSGAVRLVVRTPDGSDVRFGGTTLISNDVRLHHEVTKAPHPTVARDNQLLFPKVPVGRYIGTLRTTKWATVVFSLEVTGSDECSVFFDLEPGVRRAVRLRSGDLGPSGTEVRLIHRESGTERDLSHLLHRDEAGWRFGINWSYGTHVLEVETSTGVSLQVDFTIVPNETPAPLVIPL